MKFTEEFENEVLDIFENFALDLIGEKVIVDLDDEFLFDTFDETIYVSLEINENDEAERLVEEYFNNMGLEKLSAYTKGFLHELGHYWSNRVYRFSKEYHNEQATLVTALHITGQINGYTMRQMMEEYYKLDAEAKANDFMKIAYNSKPEVIHRYNKIIENYLG